MLIFGLKLIYNKTISKVVLTKVEDYLLQQQSEFKALIDTKDNLLEMGKDIAQQEYCGFVVFRKGADGVLDSEYNLLKNSQAAWLLLGEFKEGAFSFYTITYQNRGEKLLLVEQGPFHWQDQSIYQQLQNANESLRLLKEQALQSKLERVLLVGIEYKEEKSDLVELTALVNTAKGQVVAHENQKIDSPDPRYFLKKGKVQQIKNQIIVNAVDLIVVDTELSPAQESHLQDVWNKRVIDRNQLILDIFAKHAATKEGKIQVELAQLTYLLPRLRGRGIELSRLAGGIGTRGPGETKLEADRRRIRKRISDLKKDLQQIKQKRSFHQKKRTSPLITLVGYTNVGKSTLLNYLTDANVLTQDKLFATLDPTIRKLRLPNGRTVLLSDTVGFIKKIPHSLIAAFRATLEGVEQADLLLLIVDINNDSWEQQYHTVLDVLKELNALEKPRLTVFNKIDLHSKPEIIKNLVPRYAPAVALSGITGEGVSELLSLLAQQLLDEMAEMEFVISYDNVGLLSQLHEQALVLNEEYLEEKIMVKALIEKTLGQKIQHKIKNS